MTKKKTPVKQVKNQPIKGLIRDKLQLGMFDMEKRLFELEKKVEVIYNVSLAIDKWLKEQHFAKLTACDDEDETEDADSQKVDCCVLVQYGNGEHFWYKGKGYHGQDDWTDDLQKAERYADPDCAGEALVKISYWPDRGENDIIGVVDNGDGSVDIHPDFEFARKAEEQQQAFTTQLKKVKKRPKSQWIVMCDPEDGDTIYLTDPMKISGWRKYWSPDEEDARKFDSQDEANSAMLKYQDLVPDRYQKFYVQVIG